jgi:hypothetical protein
MRIETVGFTALRHPGRIYLELDHPSTPLQLIDRRWLLLGIWILAAVAILPVLLH